MPNGFHGSKTEWDRLEAPYVRIDPILAAFAGRHGIEVDRNYRGADRSLRYNDTLARAIWVQATDEYGANGTYRVSLIAHQDRPERFMKAEYFAESVPLEELERALEEAATRISSWTADDLSRAYPQNIRTGSIFLWLIRCYRRMLTALFGFPRDNR